MQQLITRSQQPIDSSDPDHMTALLYFTRSLNLPAVKYLLELGACPYTRTENEWSLISLLALVACDRESLVQEWLALLAQENFDWSRVTDDEWRWVQPFLQQRG